MSKENSEQTKEGMEKMEHIVLSYENRVATIELNRPNALNALHEQMLTELLQALKEVEASEADIVIIRGRGKGFSAGGDIKTMLQSANEHSFIEVMETIKNEDTLRLFDDEEEEFVKESFEDDRERYYDFHAWLKVWRRWAELRKKLEQK